MNNKRNNKHKRIADEAQFESDRHGVSPEKFEQYRKYIEEFDLSESEQRELIGTLQEIVGSFVRLGWGETDITHHAMQPRREGGGV